MHTSISSTWYLAACMVLLAHFLQPPVLRNVKVGDQIPEFSVKSHEGKVIEKASCKGKVLLLLFVRPAQKQSLKALQAVQRLLEESPDSKFFVLAISTKPESAGYFRQVASDHGLPFPIVQDPERKMYGDFGLVVSPTTLLIDESGILRYELSSMPTSYERKLRLHTDHLLGKISRSKHDELLEGKKQALSKEQRSFETRLAFARALIEKGQFKPALPVLTKLASEKRDSIDVATLHGTVYLELDRIEEAAECLDRFDHRSSNPSTAFKLVFARLEIRRGHLDAAEPLLLEALKAAPKKGRILFELGGLYERQGLIKKALNSYREALEEIFDRK